MSNETDLDWLARNVHVWAEDWTHVRKCPVHHEAKWMASLSPNAEYKDWRTKQQWLARRAELQNKPSWEDAPEWALSVTQRGNGEWFWLGSTDQFMGPSSSSGCVGEVLGDWRDTLEKRPEEFKQFTSIEDNQDLEGVNQKLKELEMLGKVSHLISDKRYRITHSKYTKAIRGVSVDVYDVLMAWGVTNPALQHLIKKALQCGQRGHKDNEQDLQDIIDSAIRAKELG